MPRIERAQRNGGGYRACRVGVRIVVVGHPSAVDSGSRCLGVAKAKLHDYPPCIYMVRKVIAERGRIGEAVIAEGYYDLVLLELSQSGRAGVAIKQVYGGNVRF